MDINRKNTDGTARQQCCRCFSSTSGKVENFPDEMPVDLSGYEIGERIISVKKYKEQLPASSLRTAWENNYNAIKHLIRSALVQQQWKAGAVIAGVITLIYDHHKSQLTQKIVEAQHDFGDLVICSQHAHLDHHNCMENIIVRGPVEQIRQLHHALSAIKGMKHTVLSMTTTGHGV